MTDVDYKLIGVITLFLAMCVACLLGTWFAKLSIIDQNSNAEYPAVLSFVAAIVAILSILGIAGIIK